MRFKETGDPEILEARSGGGFLMVFGLPFLLAGLFIMTTPLELFPVSGDDAPWYVVVPFGLVFAVVGAGLMFGRSGVIIDRRQNMVTKWYGILVPMKQTQESIGFYNQLTITREIRRGDKSSYTVYPVRLVGAGAEKINIGEPRDYQTARNYAELLAQFLKMTIVDSSSGEKVVREADMLDESIREKAQRTGEKVKMPGAPFDTKVKVRQESEEVMVDIPATGITRTAYFKLAVQLVFMATFVVWFILPFMKDMEIASDNFVFFGFVGLVCILMLIFMLGSVLTESRRSFLITASRHILRVMEKTLFRKKVIEIPVDELEELEAVGNKGMMPQGFGKTPDGRLMIDKNQYGQNSHRPSDHYGTGGGAYIPGPKMASIITGLTMLLPNSKGIVARSDTKSIQFGAGLSEPEIDYVHAVIKKAMTE